MEDRKLHLRRKISVSRTLGFLYHIWWDSPLLYISTQVTYSAYVNLNNGVADRSKVAKSLSRYLHFSLFISLFISLYISLFLSLYISLFLSLYISLSLSISF